MKVHKKKLAPFFGDVMDVYYILGGGPPFHVGAARVLMGQERFNGNDPSPGTFQIETTANHEANLILSSKDQDKHVRVVYYAQTVYQLDIPIGATRVPLKVDRR